MNIRKSSAATKATDSYYLEQRNISKEYDPTGPYDFGSWKHRLDANVRSIYEKLHEDLLYTNEKQDFNKAIATFEQINDLLQEISE